MHASLVFYFCIFYDCVSICVFCCLWNNKQLLTERIPGTTAALFMCLTCTTLMKSNYAAQSFTRDIFSNCLTDINQYYSILTATDGLLDKLYFVMKRTQTENYNQITITT